MPVIGGFERFWKNQIGYQGSNTANTTTVATAAVATRILPWSGKPDVNPNYTDPEGEDQGSLVQISAPYMTAWDITQPLTGNVHYNFLPYILSGVLHGGVTATGGTAKTWVHQPANTTLPPLGLFTLEAFGDVETDAWQLVGGFAESATFSGDESMGPLKLDSTWRFASAGNKGSTDFPVSGTVPTPALSVESDLVAVNLADCELFIDATAGGIGTTKVSDALHSLSIGVTHSPDPKRFANGSNTRFDTRAFGLGELVIEVTGTFAMASPLIGTSSETTQWLANAAVKRFFELRFTSPTIITGVTPYSWRLRFPLYYKTRQYGSIGNNTTVEFAGKVVVDSTLTYFLRSDLVCTRASL